MWQLRLLGALLGLSLPFVAVALAIRAYNDVPAIQYDHRKLSVATLWASADLPWPTVRRIHRETLQQQSSFGLIKQDIGHYLVVTAVVGDNDERTYKINERLLDWPVEALSRLADDLVAAAHQGMDAAMAARQRPQQQTARPTNSGGFGRRGI